jgi:hypothetical protein
MADSEYPPQPPGPQPPLPQAPKLPPSPPPSQPVPQPVSQGGPVPSPSQPVQPGSPVSPGSPVPQPGLPSYPGAGAPEPWTQQGLPPRSAKTNAFAIAGFVFGLVGVVVLAPIFSIIGLRRIRRHGGRGRSLAITGLVLTGCWLAVIGLVAALGFYGGDQAGVGQTTAVSNIRVGQCFDADLDKNTLLVAKIADCAGPHAGEAYATATAALAGLAGKEKDLSAAEGCANSFEDFVGKAYDTSELEIFFVVLEDNEVAGGNVLCMLGKPGKQLTGSMRGSRR